jgi:hypothetical protein
LPTPPVNDVVAAVSKKVFDFNELVPDFICTEKIVASRSEGGNVQARKAVDSLFSESRKHGEQREIIAIDGTPAKKESEDAKLADPLRCRLQRYAQRDLLSEDPEDL